MPRFTSLEFSKYCMLLYWNSEKYEMTTYLESRKVRGSEIREQKSNLVISIFSKLQGN